MALLGTSGKAGLRTLRQKGASQWNLSRFQLRFLSSTSTKSENLLNLLRATGVSSVAEEYLNGFEKVKGSSPAFAVIKVGGEVVEYELETLVKTCSILHSMNLQPIVIHGGGPQMNDELKARGVEPNYIGGHRVTDEATLDVAKTIFTDLNNRVSFCRFSYYDSTICLMSCRLSMRSEKKGRKQKGFHLVYSMQ